MMGPSQADLARYTPRAPAGVLELNISDHWRAKWVDANELPEDAPVFHAYAVVYKGDKGYVTRPAGETHWRTVEGDVQNDEDIDSFLARTVYEQMGIRIKKSELVGFLECKATTRNPNFEAGAITVRPLYIVVAGEIEDVPEESGYERRRMILRDHSTALRRHYPEIDEYINKAIQRYQVIYAKGEA